MFESLKTVVSNIISGAKRWDLLENNDCRVATAALLIRAASIDSEMSDARRGKLYTALKSYFGCDDATTIKLIEDGTKAARDAVDLYHFTRRINYFVNDDRRRCIVQMMWEIIYADGYASPLEINIVWRSADLLCVPSRQRLELQHRVVGRITSAACRGLPETP